MSINHVVLINVARAISLFIGFVLFPCSICVSSIFSTSYQSVSKCWRVRRRDIGCQFNSAWAIPAESALYGPIEGILKPNWTEVG